jgi:hypothetical protein
MTDRQRRTAQALVAVLTALAIVVVVVTWLVPNLRRDSVELCGRDFRRSGPWSTQQVEALGSIHRVGSSRVREALWTVDTAWPQSRCDGDTPTVLMSRHGDAWTTWVLVGGP